MNSLYLQQIQALLGNEYDTYLQCMNENPLRGLRVNTLKTDEAELFPLLSYDLEKSRFAEHGYIVDQVPAIGNTPAHRAGLFYMQEPSASAAVTVLNPQKGMKVLDLCAAPGSKSTQIAEMLANTGLLVLNEYNRSRAQILMENIERHGSANTVVMNCDTAVIARQFGEYFDAVLCDAPCSGEGMFRKDPDAQKQWSEDNVRMCTIRQKEILENAYQCLKPGGVLVYSTCTFNMHENEEVLINFLSDHDNMVMDEADADFGRCAFSDQYGIRKAVRIFPMDGGEGHFIAKMKKCGEASGKKIKMMNAGRPADAVQRFLDQMLVTPYPYYYTVKERVYGAACQLPFSGACRLIRGGVYLGDLIKDRFEPSHHFFMSSWSSFKQTVELDEEQVQAYFHGAQLNIRLPKGWYAAVWKGHAVGGVRSDGNTLKNKYPKYLRTR